MFYNTFRTTKSSLREADNKLAGAGKTIISHRERLLNLQKSQKLKDLLITKFMQKYGIKNPEKILEDEISKFLQGQKLTDADLKRLDTKVKNILKEKASTENTKNTLTQSLPDLPKTQEIKLKNEKTTLRNLTIGNENENTLLNDNIPPKRGKSLQKILSTEPGLSASTLDGPKLSSSVYSPMNRYRNRRRYKKPEEELAELEAEFAEEEKKNKNNKRYERLDFSDVGDEWNAIAKYNRKIYEDQIKEEQLKDSELKRRNREDLDLQIKQRLRKEYEDDLKEKEYDIIFQEHQKKMDELEKEKNEAIKKQKLKEKEIRDSQMKENYIRKRLETLKDQKFEKRLVETIKESIEKEKKDEIEKKRRKNEALLRAIKENEIKIKKKLEKERLQKEEDKKMAEERLKMDMKEEIARQKYYDNIKKLSDSGPSNSQEIIDRFKKEEEEEDRKMQYYYEQKNKLAIEKEKKDELRKKRDKLELKKYLDMQIIEKKKEEDFLKSLDNEQARIWAIDCKKYNDDQIAIENKIRNMNRKNLALLKEQMELKKKQTNSMSDTEYAMNRETLEKAKMSLAQQ